MHLFQQLILVLLLILVTACGGGKTLETPVLFGKFIDLPIQGLAYQTKSTNGFTGNDGEFQFVNNETIYFYAGGVYLGSVKAAPKISIRSLAFESDTPTLHLQNLIYFLSLLDVDKDIRNGIVLDTTKQLDITERVDFDNLLEDLIKDPNLALLLDTIDEESVRENSEKSFVQYQQILNKSKFSKISEQGYQIGGSIIGLKGKLILSNYGVSKTVVDNASNFSFSEKYYDGSKYKVAIESAPIDQQCNIVNSSGEINGFDVASISIICKDASQFISGFISGLTIDNSVVIGIDNEDIMITKNGNFQTGLTQIPDSVKIIRQPNNQICESRGNFLNISIFCTDEILTLGGKTENLTGTLVLYSATKQEFLEVNGDFQFDKKFSPGEQFSVVISEQPIGQTCILFSSQNQNRFSTENINTLHLKCDSVKFNISVNLVGLIANNTVRINNKIVSENGNGTYISQVNYGESYNVSVISNEVTKSCKWINNLGSDQPSSSATFQDKTIYFRCVDEGNWLNFVVTNQFSPISIRAVDLSGNSATLTSTLTSPLQSVKSSPRTTYAVSIVGQVEGQSCTVPNQVTTDNLETEIKIDCVFNQYTNNVVIENLIGAVEIQNIHPERNSIANDIFSISNESSTYSLFFGDKYNFIVKSQSVLGQNCTLQNSSGSQLATAMNEVRISCSATPKDIIVRLKEPADKAWVVLTQQNVLDVSENNALGQSVSNVLEISAGDNAIPAKVHSTFSFDVVEPPMGLTSDYDCALEAPDSSNIVTLSEINIVSIGCEKKFNDVSIKTDNLQGQISVTATVTNQFNSLVATHVLDLSITESVGVFQVPRDGNYELTFNPDTGSQHCDMDPFDKTGSNIAVNIPLQIDCEDYKNISFQVTGSVLAPVGHIPPSVEVNFNMVTDTFNINRDGEILVFDKLVSTRVSIESPIEMVLSNSTYQQCVFLVNGVASNTLTVASLTASQLIQIDCSPAKYHLDINISGATNDLALYMGLTGEVFNYGNGSFQLANFIEYGSSQEISIQNSPLGQICRFDDNAQGYRIASDTTANIVLSVSCIEETNAINAISLAPISDLAFRQCILENLAGKILQFSEFNALFCRGQQNVNGDLANISSIDGIAVLSNLTSVEFIDTHIKTFRPLRDLPKLNEASSSVVITNNQFPSLSDIFSNSNFDLNLKNCISANLANVGRGLNEIYADEVTKVHCLGDINLPEVLDVQDLIHFPNLISVYLANYIIDDVSVLYELNILSQKLPSKIRSLILPNNAITKISNGITGIHELNSLRILDLRNNGISDFSSLIDNSDIQNPQAKLTNLTVLSLFNEDTGGVVNTFGENVNYANILSVGPDFYSDNTVINNSFPTNDILTTERSRAWSNFDSSNADVPLILVENFSFRRNSVIYPVLRMSIEALSSNNVYSLEFVTADDLTIPITSGVLMKDSPDNLYRFELSMDKYEAVIGASLGTGSLRNWKFNLIIHPPEGSSQIESTQIIEVIVNYGM